MTLTKEKLFKKLQCYWDFIVWINLKLNIPDSILKLFKMTQLILILPCILIWMLIFKCWDF